MRLILVVLVVLIALIPVGLGGGAGSSSLVTSLPLVGGLLLLALGILLTADRLTAGEGRASIGTEDRLFLAKLILAGLFLRITLAVLLRALNLSSFLAPDESTFDANAQQFCLWLEGKSSYRVSLRFRESLQVGYFYFVGTLYYIFGKEPFVPVLFNCVIGAVTTIPVFRIAREIGGREAARPAAVLVTFFPSLVLWSTLLIRDSMVILVILLIVMTVMDIRRRITVLRVAALLALLMALGTLRQYIFVLVSACMLLSFLVGNAGRSSRSVLAGVLALVGLFVLVRVAGFGVVELERASLHQLNLHRQYNAVEGTSGSILPEVDISEPVNAITYLPVGMVYFLGSPFPWQVLSPRQVLALPDVIVWYGLLPVIFLGLAHSIRTRFRDAAMLIFCITTITILYSLVEGNVGIIFRHRAQVIAPLTVFAGVGIAIRRARRAERPARARVALGEGPVAIGEALAEGPVALGTPVTESTA